MTQIRQRAIEGIKPGDTFTVVRTFTEEDTHRYADISLDYNPVHLDRRFSDIKGFPGPVCHGLLVGGMVSEIGGQMGMLASGMSFRFRKPVFFGDTITCSLTVKEVDERGRSKSHAVYSNQNGETVLEAELFGVIPGPEEREVLRAMVEEGDPTNKLRQG
ncbi:MaoC family dehydratase [bacterium]|nr:MAG: MaoC family dehydratase [bacterium]